ncbi:MAG: HAD hydrolase-like protein [Candidatus Margulisiibacteriota bacterium]
MTILICCDRDGTINDDQDFYLGKQPDWKEHVTILPGVVEGIRKLNAIPGSEFFIVTNQPGVSVIGSGLEHLTEARVDDVNQYIINELRKDSLTISGAFICPYASREYIEKTKSRGWEYNPEYIQENPRDMKPNIGMIEKAANSLGKKLAYINEVYVIGDRTSDVLAGLNAGGKGVWVPSLKAIKTNQENAVEKLKQAYPERVYLAQDFINAAEWIVKDAARLQGAT